MSEELVDLLIKLRDPCCVNEASNQIMELISDAKSFIKNYIQTFPKFNDNYLKLSANLCLLRCIKNNFESIEFDDFFNICKFYCEVILQQNDYTLMFNMNSILQMCVKYGTDIDNILNLIKIMCGNNVMLPVAFNLMSLFIEEYGFDDIEELLKDMFALIISNIKSNDNIYREQSLMLLRSYMENEYFHDLFNLDLLRDIFINTLGECCSDKNNINEANLILDLMEEAHKSDNDCFADLHSEIYEFLVSLLLDPQCNTSIKIRVTDVIVSILEISIDSMIDSLPNLINLFLNLSVTVYEEFPEGVEYIFPLNLFKMIMKTIGLNQFTELLVDFVNDLTVSTNSLSNIQVGLLILRGVVQYSDVNDLNNLEQYIFSVIEQIFESRNHDLIGSASDIIRCFSKRQSKSMPIFFDSFMRNLLPYIHNFQVINSIAYLVKYSECRPSFNYIVELATLSNHFHDVSTELLVLILEFFDKYKYYDKHKEVLDLYDSLKTLIYSLMDTDFRHIAFRAFPIFAEYEPEIILSDLERILNVFLQSFDNSNVTTKSVMCSCITEFLNYYEIPMATVSQSLFVTISNSLNNLYSKDDMCMEEDCDFHYMISRCGFSLVESLACLVNCYSELYFSNIESLINSFIELIDEVNKDYFQDYNIIRNVFLAFKKCARDPKFIITEILTSLKNKKIFHIYSFHILTEALVVFGSDYFMNNMDIVWLVYKEIIPLLPKKNDEFINSFLNLLKITLRVLQFNFVSQLEVVIQSLNDLVLQHPSFTYDIIYVFTIIEDIFHNNSTLYQKIKDNIFCVDFSILDDYDKCTVISIATKLTLFPLEYRCDTASYIQIAQDIINTPGSKRTLVNACITFLIVSSLNNTHFNLSIEQLNDFLIQLMLYSEVKETKYLSLLISEKGALLDPEIVRIAKRIISEADLILTIDI